MQDNIIVPRVGDIGAGFNLNRIKPYRFLAPAPIDRRLPPSFTQGSIGGPGSANVDLLNALTTREIPDTRDIEFTNSVRRLALQMNVDDLTQEQLEAHIGRRQLTRRIDVQSLMNTDTEKRLKRTGFVEPIVPQDAVMAAPVTVNGPDVGSDLDDDVDVGPNMKAYLDDIQRLGRSDLDSGDDRDGDSDSVLRDSIPSLRKPRTVGGDETKMESSDDEAVFADLPDIDQILYRDEHKTPKKSVPSTVDQPGRTPGTPADWPARTPRTSARWQRELKAKAAAAEPRRSLRQQKNILRYGD